MTGIALPRARRRRRRPFGPREKVALAWVCMGVVCVVIEFMAVVGQMVTGDIDVWTPVYVGVIAYWVRWGIPPEWKVIRAWLDSEDDA